MKQVSTTHRREAIAAVIRKTYVAKSEEDMEREIEQGCKAYALGAALFFTLRGKEEADSWQSFKENMLDHAEQLGADGWNQLIKEGEEIDKCS